MEISERSKGLKGKWQTVYDKRSRKYSVYRTEHEDGSGKREYHPLGFIFVDKETAQTVADDLNYTEENKTENIQEDY